MWFELKNKTEVELENIVFVQGDDYYTEDLDDMTEKELFEYLLQWFYPGEHDTNWYQAEDVNTEFLGWLYCPCDDVCTCDDMFLLSHNRQLGYAGLSRIVNVR